MHNPLAIATREKQETSYLFSSSRYFKTKLSSKIQNNRLDYSSYNIIQIITTVITKM